MNNAFDSTTGIPLLYVYPQSTRNDIAAPISQGHLSGQVSCDEDLVEQIGSSVPEQSWYISKCWNPSLCDLRFRIVTQVLVSHCLRPDAEPIPAVYLAA